MLRPLCRNRKLFAPPPQTGIAQFSVHSALNPEPQERLTASSPVDDRTLRSPYSMRLRPRFSHKPQPLHRTKPAVRGNRGKLEPFLAAPGPFFQISSYAHPGFRNLSSCATTASTRISPKFPLFLLPYGYFCFCIYSFHTHSPQSPHRRIPPSRLLTLPGDHSGSSAFIQSGEFREPSLFSTPTKTRRCIQS